MFCINSFFSFLSYLLLIYLRYCFTTAYWLEIVKNYNTQERRRIKRHCSKTVMSPMPINVILVQCNFFAFVIYVNEIPSYLYKVTVA